MQLNINILHEATAYLTSVIVVVNLSCLVYIKSYYWIMEAPLERLAVVMIYGRDVSGDVI